MHKEEIIIENFRKDFEKLRSSVREELVWIYACVVQTGILLCAFSWSKASIIDAVITPALNKAKRTAMAAKSSLIWSSHPLRHAWRHERRAIRRILLNCQPLNGQLCRLLYWASYRLWSRQLLAVYTPQLDSGVFNGVHWSWLLAKEL